MIDNYLWIAASAIVVLTLPSLMSKVFFRKNLLSFTTILLFLYYPLIYVLVFAISKVSGNEISGMLKIFGLFNILYWSYLLLIFIFNSKPSYLKNLLKLAIFAVIPAIIYSIVLLGFVRQTNSVVALDYLQHQTVVNKMVNEGTLCYIPNVCSNLFLKTGYTSFYHTVLANISLYNQNSLIHTFFILDIIWAFVVSLPIFKMFYKTFRSKKFAVLGTTLSLLVFTNGAYEFAFLIPQTLTFFFFLLVISDTKQSLKKTIAASILLLFTHFIMGAFLAVILFIKYIYQDVLIARQNDLRKFNFAAITALIISVFTLLLSLATFSIESSIQGADVKVIGATTNPVPPANLYFFLSILGFGSIIFLLSLVHYFLDKQKPKFIFFALIFTCIAASTYFLGPTYANKFLIGFSIFSTMLIINYLRDLKINQRLQIAISLVLILSYGMNFYINYQKYLTFYGQSNGRITAVTKEDQTIIIYLQTNKQDCLILSDPYTQVIIAGLTGVDTGNAQYMLTTSRKTLYEFVQNPTKRNFDNLKHIDELKETANFCFLYTSRLEEAVKTKSDFWTDNIYTYINDNDYKISYENPLRNFMINEGYKITFQNNNFILFEK